MISTSVMPLSMLLFGLLADVVPIELLLVITGPLMLVMAYIMRRSKTLVSAGVPLPKAETAEAKTQ
jgi:DHA3 family macrolide efflux protein-like MFS transporter